MTAPAAGTRPTPEGFKLEDGYQTLVGFSHDLLAAVWEKSPQPPGFDGGAKIDQTTMHNEALRTYAPRSLVELTDAGSKVAYDPSYMGAILDMINVPQTITYFYPDNTEEAFFGYVQKFIPDRLEEGKQPEAEFSIVSTGRDHLTGDEEPPVWTGGTGT